jgi:hypothetical protein
MSRAATAAALDMVGLVKPAEAPKAADDK